MHARPLQPGAQQPSKLKAARPWRGETAVFATLGLASIVAIVLAVVSILPGWSAAGQTSGTNKGAVAKYFRSGRLAADARTLASIAQYILEPERAVHGSTNQTGRIKSIGMLTNSTAGAPKA
jgi:hypothetical protein